MRTSKIIRKIIVRAVLLSAIAGGAWYGYWFFKNMPQRQDQIATTKVRRGDVVVRSYTRGELRAVRSATLSAPNLFGTVQVTRLAPLGAFAHEKDLIVEFDESEVASRLEEKQLELEQTDEQIKKAEADLAMRNNQDQVDLLSAKSAVRRAQLEVQRNELLSSIDAKKNELNLDEAKRKVLQMESDIKSRQQQALAQIATMQENKNRGLLELQREKQRMMQVKLLAPMSGLVAMRPNRTGFMFPGMQIPDIREGDQVQTGMPVADILDLSEMEMVAKVGELDRANLSEGQEAIIALDALPEKKLHGKIKSLSGTATAAFFSFDPAKKFDVVFSIDMRELLSALGAKPEQIQKILATAEQNRKRPPMPPQPMMMAGNAGGPVMMMPAAAPGQGTPMVSSSAGAIPNLSAADQQKLGEAMKQALGGKNPRDLTPDEQKKLQAKMRDMMQQMTKSAGAQPVRTPTLALTPGGPPPAGAPQMVNASMMRAPMMAGGAQRFTAQDLANANLPPPPEEDTQFDVLLRPGLLADVQITVEKIPNAIHVPMQAVFEKDGQPVVYVKKGSQFEARVIKPLKRSESTMVIASGVQPDEVIALADPTARKSDTKGDSKKSGAMSALPGGGK